MSLGVLQQAAANIPGLGGAIGASLNTAQHPPSWDQKSLRGATLTMASGTQYTLRDDRNITQDDLDQIAEYDRKAYPQEKPNPDLLKGANVGAFSGTEQNEVGQNLQTPNQIVEGRKSADKAQYNAQIVPAQQVQSKIAQAVQNLPDTTKYLKDEVGVPYDKSYLASEAQKYAQNNFTDEKGNSTLTQGDFDKLLTRLRSAPVGALAGMIQHNQSVHTQLQDVVGHGLPEEEGANRVRAVGLANQGNPNTISGRAEQMAGRAQSAVAGAIEPTLGRIGGVINEINPFAWAGAAYDVATGKLKPQDVVMDIYHQGKKGAANDIAGLVTLPAQMAKNIAVMADPTVDALGKAQNGLELIAAIAPELPIKFVGKGAAAVLDLAGSVDAFAEAGIKGVIAKRTIDSLLASGVDRSVIEDALRGKPGLTLKTLPRGELRDVPQPELSQGGTGSTVAENIQGEAPRKGGYAGKYVEPETPQPVLTASGEGGVTEGVKPTTTISTENVTEPVIEPTSTAPGMPTATADATGLARQFEDLERANRGLQPSPTGGVAVKWLADEGKRLIASGEIDPQRALTDVVASGRGMTPTETAAIAAYKRDLANQSTRIVEDTAAGKPVTPGAQTIIEQEMGRIDQAAQQTRQTWHQGGQALQVAFEPDFSQASLRTQAKGANAGVVSAKTQGLLDKNAAEIARLNKELEATKKGVVSEIKSEGGSKPKDIASVLKRLRQATGAEPTPQTGIGGKQAGAVNWGATNPSDLVRDARALARHYIENGAKTIDDVLDGFHKDMPHLSDEQVLDLLSGKYKENRILRTAEQTRVTQTMNQLKQAAEFRQKGAVSKVASIVTGTVDDLLRNAKLAGHASAPFMQGFKVLLTDSKAWAKSWPEMVKGYMGGTESAENQIARFQNDPEWAVAKKAGLDKVITVQHGALSAMEEQFRSNIVQKIPGLGKVFEHSNAAFSGFMNEARWQMWKNSMKYAPKDAAGRALFAQDMVRDIGAITGRGVSKTSMAVANSPLSRAFFSPRYTISKFEYLSGYSARAAQTAEGRALIGARYTRVALGMTALVGGAKALGADVDWDPRSAHFGTFTIGDNRVDLFAKEGEPLRIMLRSLWGQVNNGNIEKPDSKEALTWLINKTTPAVKGAVDLGQGEFDEEGNRTQPITGDSSGRPEFSKSAFLKNLAMPITLQSVWDQENKGANLAPANVVGITVRAKGKKKE